MKGDYFPLYQMIKNKLKLYEYDYWSVFGIYEQVDLLFLIT